MKVLHLVGSQSSQYYYDVSLLYAPGFLECFTELDNRILLAHLDGTWSIPESLSQIDLDAAKRYSLPDALKIIREVHKPDIMQPHMFCYKGMTTFRYVADLLDIPMVGCPGHVMALTTDKWQSRAVVKSVGVRVPNAQLLREGCTIQGMKPPFILKPCREDNSMGVTLVREEREVEKALQAAFEFDDMILCEEFIPLGREMRVGVIDSADGKSLELLPTMEYFLHDKALPIRTSVDKLQQKDSTDGGLAFSPVDRQIPAPNVDSTLLRKLEDLAFKSHRALGCEHYSLYDVRVSPEGEPYFIEASTYCSFSPKSVIVTMGRGEGKYDNKELFYRLANNAILAHKASRANTSPQVLGMRARSKTAVPEHVTNNVVISQ